MASKPSMAPLKNTTLFNVGENVVSLNHRENKHVTIFKNKQNNMMSNETIVHYIIYIIYII